MTKKKEKERVKGSQSKRTVIGIYRKAGRSVHCALSKKKRGINESRPRVNNFIHRVVTSHRPPGT
jgi:hypothetical protein